MTKYDFAGILLGAVRRVAVLTRRVLKIIAGLFEAASTSKIEGQLIGHVGIRGSTGYFIPAVLEQRGAREPLSSANDPPREPNEVESLSTV